MFKCFANGYIALAHRTDFSPFLVDFVVSYLVYFTYTQIEKSL